MADSSFAAGAAAAGGAPVPVDAPTKLQYVCGSESSSRTRCRPFSRLERPGARYHWRPHAIRVSGIAAHIDPCDARSLAAISCSSAREEPRLLALAANHTRGLPLSLHNPQTATL